MTHDSPEDRDHSEPSVSGLIPPVTGGVASESLVVDDTDLLHEGLQVGQLKSVPKRVRLGKHVHGTIMLVPIFLIHIY